jgi:preprotein translocase subunit SecG
MEQIVKVIQIISAILLIVTVLLQSQGSGLGDIFGGSGNVFRKKRGIEKLLFQITVVLALAFFGASLVRTII